MKVETFKYYGLVSGESDFKVHPCAKRISPAGRFSYILVYRHSVVDGKCTKCGESVEIKTK